MSAVQRSIAALKDERRADYLFDTKTAAIAVRCHPNKFGTWFYPTREKLLALANVMPAEVGAEFTAILARAAEHRQKDGGKKR